MSRPGPQNWLLLGLALLITIIGLVSIWSAQIGLIGADSTNYAKRQLIFMGLGVVAYGVIGLIPLRWILRAAFPIWLFALISLIAVLVIGENNFGATRWIDLGPIDWQPSESAKLALIVCGAAWLPWLVRTFGDIWAAVLLAAIDLPLLVLTLIEPDLGTTLAMASILLAHIVAGPLSLRKVGPLLAAVIIIVPLAGYPMLHDYQRQRIHTFLHPELDAQGSGYQVIQSKIAIGSGGLFGKGLGKGSQNRGGFIPGQHTDFIFTVIGEEGGLVGAIGLLLAYAVLYGYLILLAMTVGNVHSSLIITGVVALLAVQTLVNLAMTIGQAPVTGIPLPFMSYGGSALLHTYMALGAVNAAVRYGGQSAEFARGL
ncbi:MAG TPA: FtsW/RodA/SpoVE family cell cycle protein [bacterium]|nr:FtsW/RodA/SpoVE family cell cycle protein [bacterium]